MAHSLILAILASGAGICMYGQEINVQNVHYSVFNQLVYF